MWIHDKGTSGIYYEERVKDSDGKAHILSVKVSDSSRRAKK